MMHTLKTANLFQMSLDDLLCLDAMADMLTEKYVSYALPCPDWLKKRNREIQRAITVAIEKEVETAEEELKALERQAVKDKLAQLQKAMPPRHNALMYSKDVGMGRPLTSADMCRFPPRRKSNADATL